MMYCPPTASPASIKSLSAKRLLLRTTQEHFRRACDQIVLLNKRMEGVLYRYHAARESANRGFRYKLRLRLAIVEGIRNMFYEYANRKAYEIVNLRRELFGEIVEVVSDESANDRYFAEDDTSMEEYSFTDSETSETGEEQTETNENGAYSDDMDMGT